MGPVRHNCMALAVLQGGAGFAPQGLAS